MKNIYENFKEMAKDFTNGEYIFHQLSNHSAEICELWQHSILEFANALDLAGIELPQDEEIYDKFWGRVDEALIKWEGGLSRRKPFSRCLGKISVDEAKQRYNIDLKIGMKLKIPQYELGEIGEDYYEIT